MAWVVAASQLQTTVCGSRSQIETPSREWTSAPVSVVARIPVSGNPQRVAVGEGAVWVTTTGSHSALWRIDPRSNETVAVIPVPPRARRVATGAGYVWVTSGRSNEEQARRRGMLSKIDPRTDQIVGSVRLGFRPDGVVIANGLVWVAIAPV